MRNISDRIELTQEEFSNRVSIVNNSYGGILPQYETFYLRSILYTTERCLAAFGWYEANKCIVGGTTLVGVVQEAVGHAAALSRYFWPTLNPNKKRKIQTSYLWK
jgi:hypothetical protein